MTTLEGHFSGGLWDAKVTMTSSISTSTVDSNLGHFFNQVGSIPSSARWQELFQLAANELGSGVGNLGSQILDFV